MPNSPRNADAEFLQGPRLPGALRFNLDKVAELDPAKNPLGLTHMLPSAETFRAAVEQLGITPDTHVVVYDTVGVFSAPRGVFTFKGESAARRRRGRGEKKNRGRAVTPTPCHGRQHLRCYHGAVAH